MYRLTSAVLTIGLLLSYLTRAIADVVMTTIQQQLCWALLPYRDLHRLGSCLLGACFYWLRLSMSQHCRLWQVSDLSSSPGTPHWSNESITSEFTLKPCPILGTLTVTGRKSLVHQVRRGLRVRMFVHEGIHSSNPPMQGYLSPLEGSPQIGHVVQLLYLLNHW